MDLPPGAPAALAWFLGWAAISIILSQLIGLFRDSDGHVGERAHGRSKQAMAPLNEYLQALLRPASMPKDDPYLERPVSDREGLRELHSRVSDAWYPLHRHDLLRWATDTGRLFCGIHLVGAIPMGLSWWFTGGNDVATRASIALFSFLLLPIAFCVLVQLVNRFHLGLRPND